MQQRMWGTFVGVQGAMNQEQKQAKGPGIMRRIDGIRNQRQAQNLLADDIYVSHL